MAAMNHIYEPDDDFGYECLRRNIISKPRTRARENYVRQHLASVSFPKGRSRPRGSAIEKPVLGYAGTKGGPFSRTAARGRATARRIQRFN